MKMQKKERNQVALHCKSQNSFQQHTHMSTHIIVAVVQLHTVVAGFNYFKVNLIYLESLFLCI